MYHCQLRRGVMSARHLCCAPGLTLQLLCVCSCSAAASDNFIAWKPLSSGSNSVNACFRSLCFFPFILLIAPRVNKSLVVNDAAPLRSHTRLTEPHSQKSFVDELGVFCGCCHWILTRAPGLLIPRYAREVRINTPYMCHVKV